MNLPTMIRVTADHIRDGEPNTCWGCPLALAILDSFPVTDKDDYDISAAVDMNFAELRIDGEEFTADLPGIASDFVWELDHDRPVSPFEFEVAWQASP